MLDHRWFLAEKAGHDVPMGEAVTSYIDNALPSYSLDSKALAELNEEADSGVIDDDAETGGHGAPQKGKQLHRTVGRHSGHAVFRDNRMCRERGNPPGIKALPPPCVNGRRGINAQTFAPVQHHQIALFHMADSRPALQHTRRRLVPEHMRQKPVFSFLGVYLAQLRAANGGVQDFNKHLTALQPLRQGKLVHHQRFARTHQNCRFALNLPVHVRRLRPAFRRIASVPKSSPEPERFCI